MVTEKGKCKATTRNRRVSIRWAWVGGRLKTCRVIYLADISRSA